MNSTTEKLRHILRVVVLATLFVISTGCTKTHSPVTEPDSVDIPQDFTIKYLRGGDPVRGPLLYSLYSVTADGRVNVTGEFPREIKTEERQLTSEQVETLAKRVRDVDLFEFAKRAETLRENCRKRETDQPRRMMLLQWNGQKVTIIDDFDPERCSEVIELRKLTDDLPRLLEGLIIKAEQQKAPWPRDLGNPFP